MSEIPPADISVICMDDGDVSSEVIAEKATELSPTGSKTSAVHFLLLPPLKQNPPESLLDEEATTRL
ncbi:MAG: hypothetical protein ABW185_13365 [Sedimenticola sp.]